MNIKPSAHPFNASTYGNESTPDPMALAHNEKILPLKEPFSNLPKALLKKGLLYPLGENGIAPGLTLISALAFFMVVGEAISSNTLVELPNNKLTIK